MKENTIHGEEKVKVSTVTQNPAQYSVFGSYADYEFEAIVSSEDNYEGIDDGFIVLLRIVKITHSNGDSENETVFDYDCGWHAGSEDEDDVKAYESIRNYLETMELLEIGTP